MGFVLRAFRISVEGEGYVYHAKSRARALGDAFHAYTHARGSIKFADFLRLASCRQEEGGERFGDPITVLGKPAFFVTSNRQYVQFVRPGRGEVFNSHPLDVLPVEYRPDTYRSEKFDAQALEPCKEMAS
ncbi:hypothetical protein [Sphingomonas oryzagri]|uniref:Uncharacterized protein n=1 Tax=Sphingomonas oryzagri TaxID=3042314 RepID=A0ABT6N7T4_9SPHN|nr:hypothetical protein [Sphingomonas oryzagri]MDH7641176.1 hypothetical protein [Sphingomonas oryzagri]